MTTTLRLLGFLTIVALAIWRTHPTPNAVAVCPHATLNIETRFRYDGTVIAVDTTPLPQPSECRSDAP